MIFEFKLPDLGEGVVEGEIVKWLAEEGDLIGEDQPLVQVMTDKATVEIPSPQAGRVIRRLVPEGQICHVGEVLVSLETDGATATSAGAPGPAAPAVTAASPSVAGPATGAPGNGTGTGPATFANAGGLAPVRATSAAGDGAAPVLATPAIRRLARELGVDLRTVIGSGPHGRLTVEDVRLVAGRLMAPPTPGPAPAPGPSWSPPPPPVASEPARALAALTAPREPGAEERVPFRGVRRTIAERMVLARRTAAHYTHVDEADVTELEALRARLGELAAERGVKLSILPFVAKAVTTALRRHPLLNARLDEERGEIVLLKRYHLGIATATEAGLIVPVVRDADRHSILELAAEIARLAERARRGEASHEELRGSTFTITSLGPLGGILATPILNHPEVAILGLHRVRRVPVVRGDAIVPRDVVNLSLSLDHRVVDGHVGARFLAEVITLLEDPARWLVELA
jgi:pyruvate dehydrogenase E2 component (dihydrolipoamide acetyltransferase)